MRILFLSNFYPPYELGGQEITCQEVASGLQLRGHQILVLTSMHGVQNTPQLSDEVHRIFYLEMDLVPLRQSITFFTRRKQREAHNLETFDRYLQQFNPDIVFIWGMWNLPKSLPAMAEARCPEKVVYRFGDYWPTLPSQYEEYWRIPGQNFLTKLPKRLMGFVALKILSREFEPVSLKFKNSFCISYTTRRILSDANIPVSESRIIFNGIDIKNFAISGQNIYSQKPLEDKVEIVYAGRLSPEKGVDTAIKAMAKIATKQGLKRIRLHLLGSGPREYEHLLRDLVIKEGIVDCVTFMGRIEPEMMPEMLNRYAILLVPSKWPEPFGRVVLEGMASNLAVITTPTGGPGEIIIDGENGLVFTPNDPVDLANKITCLITDQDLYSKLILNGQQTILMNFTATKMLNDIEAYLLEVVDNSQNTQS